MFHVMTVHFQSEAWIESQVRYIRRFLPEDTKIWASLNGIISNKHWRRFDYAAEVPGTHAEKLNHLARLVLKEAAPTDHLLFIDGDALPIAAVTPDILGGHRLAAVQRFENLGDLQPHPCFCVTTAELWKEIDGDWRQGHQWVNSLGYKITDVGGNLLKQLEDRNIAWTPLLRSNVHDYHRLFYGIYGNVVYHHGAGFRSRGSRLDWELRPARIPASVPILHQFDYSRAVRASRKVRPGGTVSDSNDAVVSRRLFERIENDEPFLEEFMTTPDA